VRDEEDRARFLPFRYARQAIISADVEHTLAQDEEEKRRPGFAALLVLVRSASIRVEDRRTRSPGQSAPAAVALLSVHTRSTASLGP
jgi:hypothetical protein